MLLIREKKDPTVRGTVLSCGLLAWPQRFQLNSFIQQQQGLVPWTPEGRWEEDCKGESHHYREKFVYWEALCALGSMWKGVILYRDVKMTYSSTSFCLLTKALIHYFCFSWMAERYAMLYPISGATDISSSYNCLSHRTPNPNITSKKYAQLTSTESRVC